ncbi:DUF4129 domain-containing protein [Halobacteria archaeon HArc-gm2]|nr:DUF4129 domain-containing protein [Halobacteria archaeon HArc-gm2]
MDRTRLFRGVAVAVAVLAVATVAGGFTSAGGGDGEGARSPGLGIGEGDGAGLGDGDDVGLVADEEPGGIQLPAWLVTVPLAVVVWSSLAFFLAFVVHTAWTGRLDELVAVVREALVDVLAAAVLLLGLIALLSVLSLLLGAGGGGLLGGGAPAGPATGGGERSVAVPSPSLVTGVAVVLGLLGAVGAAVALGREVATDESESTSSSGGSRGRRHAVGGFTDLPEEEAVSDVHASNPVYRAWREMADRAESATDDTLTANEVAATAVGHGFDPDAVRELTALFEAVRYGDQPVTDTRRRRAESALESIDEPEVS